MGALRIEAFVSARAAQPWWVRGLNAAGGLLPVRGAPDADRWWEAACRREPDAGEPTPKARAALSFLVDSLRSDAQLSFLGRISARDDTVRMARTHLRVQKAFGEAPEIGAVELPPPVFIVGWPRTGTTALHQILARDPANRTIPYWESFDPVPPTSGPDRRIQRLESMLAQLRRLAPAYDAIHPMEAEMPEECVALFMNDLRSLQYDFQYRAPTYVRWLLSQDARIAYRGYRRQLQLLQHHRAAGTRLVLKDPTHLVHLDALLAVFPDAKIIFTHREPATALSSLCSLYAYTRALFSDDVDPEALGREVLSGHWPEAQDRATSVRARLEPKRHTDVRHADLLRNPMGTIEEIYRSLDLPLSDEARAAMSAYVAAEAAAPRHVHVHSPEGFGLSREEIRERLSAYCATFDV